MDVEAAVVENAVGLVMLAEKEAWEGRVVAVVVAAEVVVGSARHCIEGRNRRSRCRDYNSYSRHQDHRHRTGRSMGPMSCSAGTCCHRGMRLCRVGMEAAVETVEAVVEVAVVMV